MQTVLENPYINIFPVGLLTNSMEKQNKTKYKPEVLEKLYIAFCKSHVT